MLFEIDHLDAHELMRVEAESRGKAVYKNFLAWSDAFCNRSFHEYLGGLKSCRHIRLKTESKKKGE